MQAVYMCINNPAKARGSGGETPTLEIDSVFRLLAYSS